MSLRVVILTRTKEAIFKNISLQSDNFKYKDGLYVISPKAIANHVFKGKVEGSEIIFFEGNPNPITSKGIVDGSNDFMDDEVLVNALKQTSHSPGVDLGQIKQIFSAIAGFFTSPVNFIYVLFYALIAYALITSLIRGELF